MMLSGVYAGVIYTKRREKRVACFRFLTASSFESTNRFLKKSFLPYDDCVFHVELVRLFYEFVNQFRVLFNSAGTLCH